MPKPPTDDKLRRLTEKLEARRAKRGEGDEPPVVRVPFGVLPDEYARELFASGKRTKPGLFVNEVPQTPEEIERWTASTARYQAWLLSRGKALAEGLDAAGADDLQRRAYRASLTGEPMPE